jgi:hypothetical protein
LLQQRLYGWDVQLPDVHRGRRNVRVERRLLQSELRFGQVRGAQSDEGHRWQPLRHRLAMRIWILREQRHVPGIVLLRAGWGRMHLGRGLLYGDLYDRCQPNAGDVRRHRAERPGQLRVGGW